MHELSRLCETARGFRVAGEPLFLATIVRVAGSSYRRPGARLLFTTGRVLAGSVSGGCLEADLVRTGPWAVRAGPVLRSYDARDDDGGLAARTGCGGAIELLIEADSPLSAADPLPFIAGCLEREERGCVVTVFQSARPELKPGDRLLVDAAGVPRATTFRDLSIQRTLLLAAKEALSDGTSRGYRSRDAFEALIEVVEPPPHLFVFGGGPDALPIAELARAIGWNVSVWERHQRPSVQDRFFGRAQVAAGSTSDAIRALNARATPLSVIMSHDYEKDRERLRLLLGSRARYIGVLGPARRTRRMLGELMRAGEAFSEQQLSRVHGPAGLHLGGETPAEVALSIISEAQAVLRGTSGAFLRDRRRPIHERNDEAVELRVVQAREA